MQYRDEIDGLRAIAVLPVILFHAGFEFFSGGYVGVDVFFVISGYLISTIIFTQIGQDNFSLKNFYENRARRILPALFFVMLCCIPFAWAWMNLFQWYEFSRSLIWTTFFSSNIFFWQHSGYFASASEMKPLLHTWSLAVEEQYYLVFPLLVMLLWKLGKKTLWTVLIAIGCYSFYYCVKTAISDPSSNFFLTLSRIWELLIGSLCAALLMRRDNLKSPKTNALVSQFLSIAGLLMILASVHLFNQFTPFPSAYTLLPVVGSALIILWANPDNLVGKLLSQRFFVFIGLISYSAYLWHQPIFAFARIQSVSEPPLPLMLVFSALSIGLAYFTWKFVEQPFRKKSSRRTMAPTSNFFAKRWQVFTSALIGMIFFASTGYAFSQRTIVRPGDAAARLVEARLDKVKDERAALLHFNRCHIVAVGEWKKRWDCGQDADINSSMQPVNIAIVGDSHAADKAGSLRVYGLVPLQFTGSSCSLVPSVMNNPCRPYLEFAREEIRKNDQITELWLANYYFPEELTEKALREMFEYWAPTGKKLVFYTNVPIYDNFTENLLLGTSSPRYVEPVANFDKYDLSNRPEVYALAEEYNAQLFDTVTILCGSKEYCNYQNADGDLLNTDNAHFARNASFIFGKNLICSAKSAALNTAVDRQEFCRDR